MQKRGERSINVFWFLVVVMGAPRVPSLMSRHYCTRSLAYPPVEVPQIMSKYS